MSNVIIPTSDEDKKRIKDCVIEISNAKTMMEAQRDFIKEAINSCVEDVEVAVSYTHLTLPTNREV